MNIESICQGFESDWNSESRLSIEAILKKYPESDFPGLTKRLVELEQSLRNDEDAHKVRDELNQRFSFVDLQAGSEANHQRSVGGPMSTPSRHFVLCINGTACIPISVGHGDAKASSR